MPGKYLFHKISVVLTPLIITMFLFSVAYAASREDIIADSLNDIEEGKTSDTFRQKLKKVITEETPAEETPWEVDAYVKYMPTSGVHNQSGKVGLTDVESQYSYEFKVAEKIPVKLAYTNKYISIDNTTAVKLPAHLTGMVFDVETTLPFFNVENTYFRLGVSPSFYTDNWSAYSSAFRMPSRYMMIHRSNEQFTWVLGVAAFPDYETPVLPIAGFIYKPNDKLTFNIIPSEPTIEYDINDKLGIFAEMGIIGGEYEVTKDDMNGLKLEYDDNYLGGGVNYSPTKNINASLSVGGSFNRLLQYRDSFGKVSLKNNFYTKLRVEMSF